MIVVGMHHCAFRVGTVKHSEAKIKTVRKVFFMRYGLVRLQAVRIGPEYFLHYSHECKANAVSEAKITYGSGFCS